MAFDLQIRDGGPGFFTSSTPSRSLAVAVRSFVSTFVSSAR